MTYIPTRVINLHNAGQAFLQDPLYVYIGRPSKWGNPYELPEQADDTARQRVIVMYAEWLFDQKHLLDHVGDLRGRILGCWCAPKLCHGSMLAMAAEKGISHLKEHLKFAKEIAGL